MTGFGKYETTINDTIITISLRSVNSKQLEISSRLPYPYKEIEFDLRSIISRKLGRGKVEFSITSNPINNNDTTKSSPNIFNREEVIAYYKEIISIADELKTSHSDIFLTKALSISGAINNNLDNNNSLEENEIKQIKEATENAILELIQFREQEGAVVAQFFEEKINNISSLLESIAPYEEERVTRIRQRFEDELSKLDSIQIDNNRLEQEMIYYIEKLDINEEKIRLKNHLNYFLETMKNASSTGIGKKLGFIGQEIGREINTLGSKSNHAEMQKIVVQMKDELEQIKEQILNIL